MLIRNKTTINLIFPELPQPVFGFWSRLVESLRRGKALPAKFTVSLIAGFPEERRPRRGTIEPTLTPEEVESFIQENELLGFAVTASGLSKRLRYHLSFTPGAGFACFTTHHEPKARVPSTWSNVCENLLSHWPSIGGWVYHTRYQGWQMTRVLDDSYERIYGPFPPGYRIHHQKDPLGNSLFDRTLFDISLNPGRPKELFLEPQTKWMNKRFYATAEMWLGPHFWQYAKCKKEDALAADFFIEKRDTPHYLYLKCWPKPFTRPDGEQGRMQQRLWKLFFHEDCEWPPGSGNICDEPMYGPRELWLEGLEYPYPSDPSV